MTRLTGAGAGAGTGPVTVRVSLWIRIPAALGLAFGVVMLALGHVSALTLVSAGLGLVVTAVGLNQWRAAERGIERRFWLRPPSRIDWNDLAAVELEPSLGNVVLRSKTGERFEVSFRMEGASELAGLVVLRAGPDVMTEAVRATLERRFRRRVSIPMALPLVADAPAARDAAASRWRENPFFMLGLSPECSRADAERAGQKLLALLAIDSGPAKTVVTPLGEVLRTPDAVRAAMAELRDPERRLLHELWARLPRKVPEDHATDDVPDEGDDPLRPWAEARARVGMGFRP